MRALHSWTLCVLGAYSFAATGHETAPSIEPPVLELPRNPSLSPDGSRVAFSHQGDLWVASAEGGLATRLTANDSYDGAPVWSPDGEEIAFLGRRHGNFDAFLIDADGSAPQRVTHHSESEGLHGWIDGDHLLLTATRNRYYARRGTGIWIGHRDGRSPTLLLDTPVLRPAISPDGSLICYERGHGDPGRRAYRGAASSALWVYDVATRTHRELTVFDGNDLDPMFSPDGSTIYFLSDRACRENALGRELGLWSVPAAGGEPELVYHPGKSSLRSANIARNDGTIVAEIDAGLMVIDPASRRANRIEVRGSLDPIEPIEYDRTVSNGASELAVSPDGESIAFEAGGDIYVLRKHDDIKRVARVTTAPEPDYNPVWVDDGAALLFLSERDGNGEVYRVEPEDEDTPFYKSRNFTEQRLTVTPQDEASLTLSPDGKWLAWVVMPGQLVVGDPETLAIGRTVTDGFDTPDYVWSPDSAWMAYSKVDDDYNSEVYVARALPNDEYEGPGATPFNVTRHPDDDYGPIWSPDGRKLAFTSQRQMLDETDVYVAWLRKDDVETTELERLEDEDAKQQAKKKKGKKAKKGADPEPEPEPGAEEAAADDGISGTWEGTLTGDELPGGSVSITVTLGMSADGSITGDVEVPMGTGTITGGSFDKESGAFEASVSTDEGMDLTISGTVSGGSMTGTVVGAGMSFDFSMSRASSGGGSDGDGEDGEGDEEKEDEDEVEPVVIDFDRLYERIRRLTRKEGNESVLGFDADSEKVYFNASLGTRLTSGTTGDTGFFEIGVRGDDEKKLEGSSVFSFTNTEKGALYVRGGSIRGREGKEKTYGFSVTFRENRRELRRAVMEQAWRVLDRGFYDPAFHGHDWSASLEKWRPLAVAASTGEDYGLMVNWMLGEMNASHMGYRGGATSAPRTVDSNTTAVLGVLWDRTYNGPGRKVAEVIDRLPASRERSRLEVGDIVLAVDGEAFEPGDNWAKLMLGRAGNETELLVRNADGEEREMLIRPASYFAMRGALYRRWTHNNRAHTEDQSGGRIGYIHIEGMGTGSLLEFERDLFNAGAGKDCLVIDVRENGGGWTTDMVLAMLMVRDHAVTIPRGGGPGYPQGRRIFATWDKPVVVLCNENSYSNAEIFSWSIKTLERGPVVGKTTYGAVISTGGAGLLDGSFVRLPMRGWYVNNGEMTNMEHNGCPPDYPVENLPGDYVLGLDRQLDKAIEVGLELVQ